MINSAATRRASILFGVLTVFLGLLVLPTSIACGEEGAARSTSAVTPAPAQSSSTSVVSGSSSLPISELDKVFVDLAVVAEPMVIFAPTGLPQGAVLSDEWWPVAEVADPDSYEGSSEPNPRVLGAGSESEIQVVYDVDGGWLVILENFQGDLGDVTGMPVGEVAGEPAALYEVNGGQLVQWSQDGRWYGVFGRGIPEEDVIDTALGMQRLPPGGP